MSDGERRFRPAAVLGCLLALPALVLSLALRRDHPGPQVRTVEVSVVRPVVRPAADGCPAHVTCTDATVRPQLFRAVSRAFPGGHVIDTFAVIGAGTRQPYRETVRERTRNGMTVDVTAVCLLGAAPVHPRSLVPLPEIGPASVTIVVPGAAGCSVAVVLSVPAGSAVTLRAARALAQDAQVQIRP